MNDITTLWLKQNDPVYKQRSSLDYPYLSEDQMSYRQKRRETPASNIDNPTLHEHLGLPMKGVEE